MTGSRLSNADTSTEGAGGLFRGSREDDKSGTPSLVTTLFADVVSSTAHIAPLDAEEARDLLDAALSRMRQRVHQFGGTLARVQGDGVMAIFGAPVPIEDHALRACCAARAICDEFQASQADGLAVRVGVHSGKVLTRLQRNDYGVDYDAIGAEVHIAAKAELKAKPNTAAITAATLELAGPSVTTVPCGELELGAGGRTTLYELKSIALDHNVERLFERRPLAPLVGRHDVLQHLIDQVRALAGGRGTATAIVADAGMGKSRLLYEISKLAPALGVRIVELRGVSIKRRTPFAPLRPFAMSLLGRADDASADSASAGLSAVSLPPRMLSGLRALLNLEIVDSDWTALEASARRRTIFEAVTQVTVQAAGKVPILVFAEDAHYFDWESAHFLERLQTLGDQGVGLVVTARKIARERAVRAVAETIDLEPLSAAEARELCAHVAAGSTLSQAALERVVARASGNPLFLQELVRSLRAADGTGPSADALTPLSVASLTQARLGSLSAAARSVIQAASILGDDIDPRVLALTANVDEMDLPPILTELASQDLVDKSDPRTLRFRHELFRDGARNSLLRTQATQIHARALEAFESILPDAPEISERAAFHAEHAGQAVRALKHLRGACKRGIRNSSLRSVRALYDWAMRFRDRPEKEAKAFLAEIVLMSADALQQSGELEEWERSTRIALSYSQSIGDRKTEAIVRAQIANIDWVRGRSAEAVAEAEKALDLVKDVPSVPVRSLSLFALANAHFQLGDLDKAIALQRQQADVLAGFDKSRLGAMLIPSVQANAYLAGFLSERGEFSEATAIVDAGEAMLSGIDQPYSRLLLRTARGILSLRQGRYACAIASLDEAREICFEHQLLVMEAPVSGWLSSALTRAGEAERGRAIARNSIQNKLYLHCAVRSWVIVHQALAEADFACGYVDEALATIDKAVSIAAEQVGPVYVAQARFARGAMLAEPNHGDPRSPDVDLNIALELAEKHGLRPLEADCHRSLGGLARRDGNEAAFRLHAERATALYRQLGMTDSAAEFETRH